MFTTPLNINYFFHVQSLSARGIHMYFETGQNRIRIPSISPAMLCDSALGKKIKIRNRFRDLPWWEVPVPAGEYCFQLPVSDSNHKPSAEQETLLLTGEEWVSFVVGALGMMCLRLSGYTPYISQGIRIRDLDRDGTHLVLSWESQETFQVFPYSNIWAHGEIWLAASKFLRA